MLVFGGPVSVSCWGFAHAPTSKAYTIELHIVSVVSTSIVCFKADGAKVAAKLEVGECFGFWHHG